MESRVSWFSKLANLIKLAQGPPSGSGGLSKPRSPSGSGGLSKPLIRVPPSGSGGLNNRLRIFSRGSSLGGALPRTSLRFQRLCSNVTPRALHHVFSYAEPPYQAHFIMFVPPGERPRGRLFTRASEQSCLGGRHCWWKAVDVVFLMNFILVAWRQAHPGYVFKINPTTSLVCLGSVGHHPVYYRDITFICDFISCACAHSSLSRNTIVVIFSIDFPGTDSQYVQISGILL